MFAPASQAAFASGQLVMPQILTRIMVWLDRLRRTAQKSSERGGRIGRKHQAFANQKRVEPCVAKFREVIVGAQPGLADCDTVSGNPLDKFERGLDAQAKRLQIAIVDADDARFGGQSAIQLGGGMNFDERLHANFAAERDEVAKKFIAKRRDNQQK